jgi:hypothetical protein
VFVRGSSTTSRYEIDRCLCSFSACTRLADQLRLTKEHASAEKRTVVFRTRAQRSIPFRYHAPLDFPWTFYRPNVPQMHHPNAPQHGMRQITFLTKVLVANNHCQPHSCDVRNK